ncbi:MAG: hypothetical protein H7Y31_17175 [Chitinophagaceae bacterium]|nr:hypothetical protein [Chitinophagaceae bacterium]
MAKKNEPTAGQEEIKAENDFLKMKMMLERGAHFGKSDECTPEMENQFLNYVMKFEEKAENASRVTVFEKIGRPTQFISIDQIPAEQVQEKLDELLEYMENHGVSLDVFSPNISAAELYRFAVEELFQINIVDLKIPGVVEGFVYDSFYPDHKHENIERAVDGCMEILLSENKFSFMDHFRSDALRLNDHYPLSQEEFKALAYNWKKHITDFHDTNIFNEKCVLEGEESIVSGQYKVHASAHAELVTWDGNWQVRLELNKEISTWEIVDVQIAGISF